MKVNGFSFPLRCFLGGALAVASVASTGTAFAGSAEDDSLRATAFTSGRSAVFGGRLFLVVDDGVHGGELWATDGTSAGTGLVRDIVPGAAGSGVANLTVAGNVLFFTVNSGDLWRTDGTASGTSLVKAGVSARDLEASGATLFFSGQSGAGRTVWKSNGTANGTVQVAASPTYPRDFCAVNGVVYFAATGTATTGAGKKKQTVSVGEELWKTDGTAAGTVLVKDIYVGAGSSSPAEFVGLNGVVYFTASTVNEGSELWRSDGTSAGTTMVKDIAPGVSSSLIARLRTHAGKLYFNASTSGSSGLWQSDGTAAGTVPATNFAPGANGFIFADFAAFGSRIVFRLDNANGSELWSTDGTAGGTQFLQLLVNNSQSLAEVMLVGIPTGGLYFYTAYDDATGTELHVTDGTPGGTRLVKDIYPTNDPFVPPLLINVTATRVFFAADQGQSGLELWSSDGRTAGTTIVRDFQND